MYVFSSCAVPAPDVRYYLQLELDQPRQMLRPARNSKCCFKNGVEMLLLYMECFDAHVGVIVANLPH